MIEEQLNSEEPQSQRQLLVAQGPSRKRFSLGKGNTICGEKYLLSYKIGQGAFGQVYLGIENSLDQEQHTGKDIAIKLESESGNKNPQLLNQANCLKQITEPVQPLGFPHFYTSGTEGSYSFMLMELLGPNLQDLMTICGGKFSMKTTLLLGIQVVERLELLHSKGFVYRDVKPENFVMGLGKQSNLLYVIDYGLCKRYRDAKTSLHYPYRQDRQLTGTIRYSSLNAHLGIEQSRRDDLESLCYMMIYFLKGKLPWQGFKNDTRVQKDHVIMEMKLKLSAKEMCEGLPMEFQNILSYCRDLGYYEDPQYSYIISEFNSLFLRSGYQHNSCYDWAHNPSNQKIRSSNLNIEVKANFGDAPLVSKKDRSEISSSDANSDQIQE